MSTYFNRDNISDKDLYDKTKVTLSDCKGGLMCNILKQFDEDSHFSNMQRAMLFNYLGDKHEH